MTSAPVEFVLHHDGRTDAMLGSKRIGVIEPHHGDADAFYRMLLPGDEHSTAPRPAVSIATARRFMLHRIAEWFADAGLLPLSEAVARQAEMERESVS